MLGVALDWACFVMSNGVEIMSKYCLEFEPKLVWVDFQRFAGVPAHTSLGQFLFDLMDFWPKLVCVDFCLI